MNFCILGKKLIWMDLLLYEQYEGEALSSSLADKYLHGSLKEEGLEVNNS